MTQKAILKKRWLRGTLENLRENTEGADNLFLQLLHQLDDGTLSWVGPQQFGWTKWNQKGVDQRKLVHAKNHSLKTA